MTTSLQKARAKGRERQTEKAARRVLNDAKQRGVVITPRRLAKHLRWPTLRKGDRRVWR